MMYFAKKIGLFSIDYVPVGPVIVSPNFSSLWHPSLILMWLQQKHRSGAWGGGTSIRVRECLLLDVTPIGTYRKNN
jgi:hypothetical protein